MKARLSITIFFSISLIAKSTLIFAQENTKFISPIETETYYTGEFFSNLKGGAVKTGGDYKGNFDYILKLDSEQAGLWESGSFFLYFQNGHGQGITDSYVGDIQVLSNIDSPEFTQVSEYYLSQNFMNNKLMFKLGKQDANNDFNVSDNAGDFINSSFGMMPNIPMPTFPDPALGVAAFVNFNENLTLSGGIYDGAGRGTEWGFRTAFCSHPKIFSIGELKYHYSIGKRGNIKIGAWRQRECLQVLSGSGTESDYGGYVIINQGILGNKGNGTFSLDSFFQYGYANNKVSLIPNFYGAGFKAAGFITSRPNDSAGVGIASARLNSHLSGMDAETSIESYYIAPINKFLALKPGVQYIINPSGKGDNALVVGMRFYLEI